MRKPTISLCPEGAVAIGFTAFSSLLAAIIECWPLCILFWLLLAFSLHFFRDPERVIPHGEGLAVSPADGTVVSIQERPGPIDGKPMQCVSIFMSVFNVHVNRSPVAGHVRDIRYFPGKFFNASLDKSSTDNERCAWLIEDGSGKNWTMVQIAGLIARRIVCRASIGDALGRGERVGMIRFGSRVDLYLPDGYTPTVKIKDKVFGGQSIIARKA